MSGFVNDAEYARIKASWRTAAKNPERWTNAQMLEACYLNVREAAQREARLRELDRSAPPGDPRRRGDEHNEPLRLQIRTAVSDQRHWRDQLAFWRGKCAEEGDDAVPGERKASRDGRSTIAEAASRRMNEPAGSEAWGVADRRLPPERDEEETGT